MEESEQLRIQTLIEEIAIQNKRLEGLCPQGDIVKRNLILFKFLKIFKERNDTYHVSVTVTKDLEEVELLSGEKVNPKNTHSGSFLVVGIILPTTFYCSLVENKFNVNVSVYFDRKRLCRQVVVSKKNTFVVIPWSGFSINSELDVSFFGKVNDKKVVFRIPTIVLNISHFMRPLESEKTGSEYGKYKQQLVEISSLYRVHKTCFFKDYISSYKMIIPNEADLLNVVLKHFPHLRELQETENYKFEVLSDTSMSSQVNLIKNDNFLEIQSDVRNLYEMKKYFIDQMCSIDINEKRALKKFLDAACNETNKEYTDVYHFLRKLWQME